MDGLLLKLIFSGLLLNYALQITSLFNRNVRLGAVVENQFNSIERIMFFSEVPQEAPAIITGILDVQIVSTM